MNIGLQSRTRAAVSGILSSYDNGISLREISDTVGLTITTIRRVVIAFRGPLPKRHQVVLDGDQSAEELGPYYPRTRKRVPSILTAYDDGKTIREISVLTGLSGATIRRVLDIERGVSSKTKKTTWSSRMSPEMRNLAESLLVTAKESQAAIAKRVGVSRQRIEQIARKNGIHKKLPRYDYDDDAHKTALELRAKGIHCSQIALKTGLTESHLHQFFRKLHLPKLTEQISAEILQKIIAMREKGESIDNIGLAVGLGITRIRTILKRIGIDHSFSYRSASK